MKKPGNTSPYTREQKLALFAAFKGELARRKILDLDDIYRYLATEAPAPCYFISEDRALIIIKHHIRHGKWLSTSSRRRKMLASLETDALRYLKSREARDITEAVYLAVNSPAPSFFLSPQTVRTYIYDLLKSL